MRASNSLGPPMFDRRTGLLVMLVLSGLTHAGPRDDQADPGRALDPVVRLTNQGVALMERYDYAHAAEMFEQAAKLAPESTEVWIDLAMALYNRSAKGDLERAEALLDDVLGAEPDNVRALYFRGIVHQYAGRDEQALTCFEQVVKRKPHDATAWYLLARSKSHLDQPSRIELERAVSENPGLASAYYDLMRLAWREGRADQAHAYREQFTKLRQSPLAEMVVMPQYRRMGALAVVQPLGTRPARNPAGGELSAGPARTLLSGSPPLPPGGPGTAEKDTDVGQTLARFGIQLATADVNGDGLLDIVSTGAVRDGRGGLVLLLGQPGGNFTDATAGSGLDSVAGVLSCAFGDYDNDNQVDLFVSCAGPNVLLRGRGDGTFEDVTKPTATAGPDVVSISAVFVDADHDADLDIYVCNATATDGSAPAANQLLNNSADGTFSDIAAQAGVACPSDRSVMLAPADLDADRDTDLVVFNRGTPARVFFNDRSGRYHQGRITEEPVRGNRGGALADFNGDGRPDLLVAPGPQTDGRLYLSNGTGMLKPAEQFAECVKAVATWGDLTATRLADLDLDGDLDLALFGQQGYAFLNDGLGRFVARSSLWPIPHDVTMIGHTLTDLTDDGIPDVLCVWTFGETSINLVPTRLTPPANWLAIAPTGKRSQDKRTRSPASGFGTRLELRCGLHSQVLTYTGLDGGLSQSRRPLIFGLNGATGADYLAITWPDGVTQCESDLSAGSVHRIAEMERRVSSCPVLFAWNGTRFEFVGDFAGVGGLGYFIAPGRYAQPRAKELVRIAPRQLVARDGFYELRVCEPMEEVAYIDRLELLAVDHPIGTAVYPDERLTLTGPTPTQRLLCVAQPIEPVRATAPDGTDCAGRLSAVDRVYAYQPPLDPRFIGFCRPHSLLLDFENRLADLGGDQRVYLFLTGSIEYPYSQTTFAAAQAGVAWQPMKIERRASDGQWETVVADAGAPGGIGRTIAIDLTGKLPASSVALRISTNLEIYYDRAFIAADRGSSEMTVQPAPLADADLHRLGFPQEYSPDGRQPTIYNYDLIEPSSSFKRPAGAYTRYGPVVNLLTDFDDRYVILGTGDEVAVRFDARALRPFSPDVTRSFILVSHAYCKDMDLYTAEPDTVEPLPFRAMSAYPY